MYRLGWIGQLLSCALVWISLSTPTAQAQDADGRPNAHQMAAAAYYSRGDYGQGADTSIYYFPVSYELTQNRWRFKTTIPQIKVSGYGNVLVNVGGIGRGDGYSGAVWESDESVSTQGLGDVLLSATYELDPLFDNAPFMEITAEVKLPTADEKKSLGTGRADYALQLDLFQLVGQTTVFSTLGYRQRRSSALFEDLRDSAFFSAGMTRLLPASWLERHTGGQWSYGIIYDYREAASDFSVETHELVPFLSWSLSGNWTLMSYLVKGFTRDSADIAVGSQLSYRW